MANLEKVKRYLHLIRQDQNPGVKGKIRYLLDTPNSLEVKSRLWRL